MRRHPDQPLTPTRRSELRELVRLAVPLALTNLGGQLMGVVDTVMLGRYSDAALAGTGIANTVILAVVVLGMGAVMGLDTLIPQALGADEPRRARRLLGVGVRIALLAGIPLTLLTAVTPQLLPLFGVEPGVAHEGTIYTYARLPGLFAMLVITAQRTYLQAIGHTRPLVVAVLVGNAVNAGLNYMLIFGVPELGIPALGSVGAALGTIVVTLTTAAILGLSIRRVRIVPSDDDARPMMRKTLRLGMPVGLQYAAEVGVFALAGILAGRLGRHPAAGHQVALMLASLFFNIALGMSSAAAVRVGYAIGRGDHAGTRRAGAVALFTVGCYACVSASALILFPETLARLFTDEPHVVAAAIPLIQIAALFQLSDCAQAVGGGVLRGAGDTRAAFVGNFIGHYLVGLPIAVVLAFPLGWGAPGLWWGLSAGLTSVAIALWLRFFWLLQKPVLRA